MLSNPTRVSVRSLTAAGIATWLMLCAPAFGKEVLPPLPLAGEAGHSASDATSTIGGQARMTTVPALLAIDQNRATLVDRIVREWGVSIAQLPDGITPDQLREVLSAMRADQLLAANLAGSPEGLRGVIKSAIANEREMRSLGQSKALGDVGTDLDYVPVVPCRLVETRGTFPAVYQGGGAFASNAIRTYTLQGGNGVCLSQLPAGITPGAVQLQVYGIPTTSGSGDIEILPQGSTFGSTATLVYLGNNAFTSSSATSRVNTANKQISVQVRGPGAHVAIDVVGYFTAPSAINLTSPGGSPSIKTTSTVGFNTIDIDAVNGDAALRFYKAGAARWNIRNNPGNDDLQFFELGASERMRIVNTTGDVVIGSRLGIGTSPAYQLQLSTNSAAKPTSNTWTIASDVRVKENIRPFTDGLATLIKINPVSYDLNGKAGLPKGEHGISVIAQEARDVVPYMVSSFKAKLNPADMTDTDVLSFDSGALSFVAVNAIKELVVMMGNQAASKDAEIASLKKKNVALEARLTAIEKKLQSR